MPSNDRDPRDRINDQAVPDRGGARPHAVPGMRPPKRPVSGPPADLPDWTEPEPVASPGEEPEPT
jgi:hypothetical protein